VEVDAEGWRIVDDPPARFRRAADMQALPTPEPGGSIQTLRRFLNVLVDNDFILVVAWVLAVLRNRGPYPVLILSGEQGSAKSTFSAVLRALLDPKYGSSARLAPGRSRSLHRSEQRPRPGLR
jgi:pantothenate kinase-related protein Tda10